jgi:hypothetical protein
VGGIDRAELAKERCTPREAKERYSFFRCRLGVTKDHLAESSYQDLTAMPAGNVVHLLLAKPSTAKVLLKRPLMMSKPGREWTGRDLNPRLPPFSRSPCEGGDHTRLIYRPSLEQSSVRQDYNRWGALLLRFSRPEHQDHI